MYHKIWRAFPPKNTHKSLAKKIKEIPWKCGYHGYENKLGFCRCKQPISDLTDHLFMKLFPHKSVAIAWKKIYSVWCPHLGDSDLETSGEAKSSVGFRKALDIVMDNELIRSDIKKTEKAFLQCLCKSSCLGGNKTLSLWWWRRNYFCEQSILWLTSKGLSRPSLAHS